MQLTFLSVGEDGSVTQRVDARGVMRRHHGEWAMKNQMTAGGRDKPTNYITQWAYMLPAEPGGASWENFPMVPVSVPAFLDACK